MNAILAAMLLANAPAPFPARVGECGWVRGRFAIYNGSSIQRLRVLGTRHVLALRDDDDRLPQALRRIWSSGAFVPGSGRGIYGAFKVCAIERWVPDHLQHIRLVDARNLIVR